MIRTHKIALDPAPRQRCHLVRLAGYARLAYNWSLRHYQQTRDAGSPCHPTLLFLAWDQARLKEYPWSVTFPQSPAKYAVIALQKAIKAWEDSSRRNQFPKPHPWTRQHRFRADKGPDTATFENKGISLPGIGAIPTREDLGFKGSIRTVTLEREHGRWFACVTVQTKAPASTPGSGVIGVDVGARKMAACSDGTTYPVPKALRHQWGKIRRYRRLLARQARGSGRRRCTWRKLQRAICRAACIREDAQHRAAGKIVAGKRAVVLETLDMADMMEQGGRRLERAISAAAMRRMQHKIIYRCEAAGIEVIMAPRGFASSQICSGCGNRKTGKMRLRDEDIYECQRCGLVIDRDENAAINLKRYGEEELLRRMHDAA